MKPVNGHRGPERERVRRRRRGAAVTVLVVVVLAGCVVAAALAGLVLLAVAVSELARALFMLEALVVTAGGAGAP